MSAPRDGSPSDGGAAWWPRQRPGDLVSYLDDAEHARLLAATEAATLPPGHVVLHKGGPARSLLLVEEGRLEVCEEALGETLVLAAVGPGGVVGEVGFIDGRVRTHDVRAGERTRVRRLTREGFLALVQHDPLLFAKLSVALGELLAARFRAAVQELEPVRAFAASLREPMELDELPEPAPATSFDEIDEPLPESALALIRDVAARAARGAAGA
jgi:CRP-like cAMP-binding protein